MLLWRSPAERPPEVRGRERQDIAPTATTTALRMTQLPATNATVGIVGPKADIPRKRGLDRRPDIPGVRLGLSGRTGRHRPELRVPRKWP
jgi:hypothetical protein